MTPGWEALSARARGLEGHLIPRDRVSALGRAPDISGVAHLLRATPYAPFLPHRTTRPEEVEVAIQRSHADRIAVLALWARPRTELLAPLFLEEDLRSVRALFRGAAAGTPAAERLRGSIPTPTLTGKALATLAEAPTPGRVAATLVAWGHPLGPPLLEEARQARPDLFRAESALAGSFAREATAAARAGGSPMADFVAGSIDAWNIVHALLLAEAGTEREIPDLFVHGGSALALEGFLHCAATGARRASFQALRGILRGTMYEPAFHEPVPTPGEMEERILDARVTLLRRRRREAPVSAVPVLLFVLRLRREVVGLRRMVWSASMGLHRGGGVG